MTMFRTLKIGAAAAVAGTAGLLTSCLEAPDYPTTPHIDFKEVRAERFNFGADKLPSTRCASPLTLPMATVTWA
ncbi:hypothetical protein [Hymenobacter cellulosilyticus]|uniref:Uncharacterized protein n=1 Tax=Hymenobacter cellulosilyticus TaxID=2932248 RepID=A0A8T9Q597_9BACT|nr:hypothetical protein [Hymenobacter cellulosilyticus]UOQ70273.1 hypothetical protein MUN79_16115 [Hymenobacter cellulosilyticus]